MKVQTIVARLLWSRLDTEIKSENFRNTTANFFIGRSPLLITDPIKKWLWQIEFFLNCQMIFSHTVMVIFKSMMRLGINRPDLFITNIEG